MLGLGADAIVSILVLFLVLSIPFGIFLLLVLIMAKKMHDTHVRAGREGMKGRIGRAEGRRARWR